MRARLRSTELANAGALASGQAAPETREDYSYPIELGGGTWIETPGPVYDLAKPRPRALLAAQIVSFFRIPEKVERRPAFTGAHGIVSELPLPADLMGGMRPQRVALRTFRREPIAGWDAGTEIGGAE